MITFQKITSSEQIVRQLVEAITSRLSTGKVLWLLSGGSAIQVAVAVSKTLKNQNLERLTVTLADERYGTPGHADSNWQQLLDAGFSLSKATLVPVLTGVNQPTTAHTWENRLMHLFESNDYRLALLGIGTDGHISGILPGSDAVNSPGLVASYEAGGYQRITTTPTALRQLDEAIVYAVGESKRTALLNLKKPLTISQQPAQLLKMIPRVTIYNDELGESL